MMIYDALAVIPDQNVTFIVFWSHMNKFGKDHAPEGMT